MSVGDTFTLTLSLTNYGNVAAQGTHMYLDAQPAAAGLMPLQYDTNLLERLTGPVPSEIPTIPPGGTGQMVYTFKAVAGGTNWFYARIGRTICDGQRFQQIVVRIGPQVITSEIIVNSTGDLPDLDPNDSRADTGRKLADGKTPEVTLRAAIEFANKQTSAPFPASPANGSRWPRPMG